MAIADYLQKLVELKNQLAANLRSMGVAAEDSEKLNTLVPKVLDIETGVDTSDATATAEDIAVGKTAYVAEGKIIGTKEPVVQNVEFVEGTDFTKTSGPSSGILSAISSITVPKGTTGIGDYAFFYCTNLTSITIPDSVTSIGKWAFARCSSLESITIPDSVTSIGEYVFSCCTKLTSTTIPDSVTSISNNAFYYCEKLTSITIPDSVTSIGSSAFQACTKLANIYYTGTETQWNAITKGSSWNFAIGNTVPGGTVIHYNYVP